MLSTEEGAKERSKCQQATPPTHEILAQLHGFLSWSGVIPDGLSLSLDSTDAKHFIRAWVRLRLGCGP